ncbi:FeoB-associated Cys-rich membrane protein [Paenibacillus sp. CAA11]|uniref:FeoB-associated Cys-rich membrane protein n=1 Tax=Paenibacillus sp. CAA11 TaxID=1532905 RepID=UPI000D351FDE|nr:FeoB-associated Cys-rich membrane protein [Paenibacillus sp. CAA11]AWB43930.1 FeoB-associated Cys-rich membrane protein [Paenibacillus sp. CAA11]
MIDIILGALLFSYAGWTLYRFVKKSRKGACASCSQNKSCSAACSAFQNPADTEKKAPV